MQYITFDEQGNTTGAYLQDMLPEHVGRAVEATDEQCRNWTNLRVVNGALVAVPGPTSEATLAANRAAAWEAIKAHRDRLSEQGGYLVTVGGVSKWFHSDQKSKTQQLGLLISGANVPPVPWKTMDGSFVTMSQAWAAAVFTAAAAQDIAIFGAAEAHRAAMLAAADPLAYDWRTGWPAVYGGV